MTGSPEAHRSPAFLAGGGETGALIRAVDWSASPLGPPEAWPQALRTLVGVMLAAAQPMFIAWGPQRTLLYNDAYAEILAAKHPGSMGRDFLAVWDEIRADLLPIVLRAYSGEPVQMNDIALRMLRRGYPEVAHFAFSYTPVRDETGAVAGFFCPCIETTAQVRSERRQAFWSRLEDALRGLADPHAVMATAAGLLGRHLGAQRVGYGEMDATGMFLDIEQDWTDGSMPSLAGRLRLDDFGELMAADLRAGRIVRLGDILDDERTSGSASAYAAIGGTRAGIGVPLVKDDRFVALFYVHHTAPQHYTEDDEASVREAADRTWSAVQRARAEAEVRTSETRLRGVLQGMGEGFALLGSDFTILELNDEALRLRQRPREEIVGRTHWEAFPGSESQEIGRLYKRAMAERVAVTMERRHLSADGRERWLDTRAYPTADGGLAIFWRDITDRRQAAERLRESEARFRLMADAVPQIVWITDTEGRTEFFNRQWSEYTGATFEPSTASEIAAHFVHPDDGPATAEAFKEARRGGGTFMTEHRIRSKAGEYRWFLARGEPYRDPQTGGIVRWFGASIDIHDRKLAEERLQALNADLERQVVERSRERGLIWQLSLDLLSVIDLSTDSFDSVNPAWSAALGWAPEELEGRSYQEFVHPDDIESSGAAFEQVRDGRPVLRFVNRYRARQGGWRWLSWVAVPDGGKLYSVTRDITARKEQQARLEAAEAARRESDALYRAYFENTPEALFVIGVTSDGGFVVEELNPAHEAGVGYRLEDVRGKRMEEFLPPELAEGILATYRHVLQTGVLYQYRAVFDLDGEAQHWDSSVVPVRDDTGRIRRLIGSSRNVTRQILAEDALRQAQKMEAVGQLTGGIAHDFNNLLGAVVGSLDLIRRRPDEPDRVRRFAEAGLQAAERGAKLTGQLLAFSRAQKVELKAVVVARLVEGMRELLARTLGPMARLTIDVEGDWAVLSDPTQLEMAVLNLAINARDAMPDGGALTIATRAHQAFGDGELRAGDYVEICVTDTGTGMAPDVLARAFDPFFTTKGVGRGTGLGLSQVYGIARQAGGTVRIESRPGAGTAVRIYLPRCGLPVEEPAVPSSADGAPPPVSATILVVDDDPDVRRMLVASLDALGYRVLEAHDGPSALETLERAVPDLMMADFAMPGMNGADLARAARERHPRLPIVFASGYADTAAIEAAAGQDAPVLRKPFRVGDLQAILSTALAAPPGQGADPEIGAA